MIKDKYLNLINNSNKYLKETEEKTPPKCLQDCARLLQQLGQEQALLKLKELQNFWLMIMADKSASHKDRLAASKLYAESIGAFDKNKQSKGVNGANIRWRSTPIDVDIVKDE